MKCSRCAKCCRDTEMLLSKKDIERLESRGFRREEFAVNLPGGLYRLRNVNGACYFLKDGLCSVYNDRPEGCRYYPIVLSEDGRKCIRDDFCPNSHTVSRKELKETCPKLKRLYKEIFQSSFSS
ncbi:MAG: YkgJ family cysteine cluster protein [Candidatus Jordarchaeales archaeon]|nr:YkgJ family cysteine cluster protein [Candidatus Jordarchaeia archaeon]